MSDISVVIGVRNRTENLMRCLSGLSHQAPHELIIVNYGGEPLDVDCIYTHDYGMFSSARARNIGIGNARGGIIVCIDADVLLFSWTLKRIAEVFKGNPQTVYHTFANYTMTASDGELLENHDAALRKSADRKNLLTCRPNGGGLIAATKQAFLAVNGYDEFYEGWGFEDCDMHYRLEQSGNRVLNDGETYLFHMPHEKSAESQDKKRWEINRRYYRARWGKPEHLIRNAGHAWGLIR